MSGIADVCLVKSINFQPIGDDDTIKCFVTLEWVQNNGKNPQFSGLVIYKRDLKREWNQSGEPDLSLNKLLKAQKENSPVGVVTGKEFLSYCEIELFVV
jgi:hypothetical protein